MNFLRSMNNQFRAYLVEGILFWKLNASVVGPTDEDPWLKLQDERRGVIFSEDNDLVHELAAAEDVGTVDQGDSLVLTVLPVQVGVSIDSYRHSSEFAGEL